MKNWLSNNINAVSNYVISFLMYEMPACKVCLIIIGLRYIEIVLSWKELQSAIILVLDLLFGIERAP